MSVTELTERLAAIATAIEGLTISGGEPLQQRPALVRLLQAVRQKTELSIIVFTGFTWEEVLRMPEAERLLKCVDVMIAGRYDDTQRLARDLRGSANKTVHFLTNRYGPADLASVPAAEVVIGTDGQLWVSGIDPPRC
jgi:anaerobic ribonucleoside-triphosphate reductase activating protein